MADPDGALAHPPMRAELAPRVRRAMGAEPFQAILAAAQADARWANTELWNEYAPAVAAFLRARGSREPDDLTSEVFLAVFDRIGAFHGGEAEFRAFVFTIAYRRLTDELRRRGRRGEHEEWQQELDDRRAPSAEDEAFGRLGDRAARELIDSLAPDQRDVMVLRILGDLTVEQVAAVLGKRPGAVKALQRRALESLRRKISSGRTPARAFDDGGK
ncbi:RNA polymerase sigma factor [Agromyces bracchium]|uniref:Sigma-70 family RNA polymerase sigma factor n=1 Tax=Agromyces bracchium TaxID=88376 RepID=A0A6I3MB64_9MICO|nr:sigma-70 family RNA polymerase sigma factor [Agromyces bracchium]MTH70008.1 sigma-70 family RNA polymerase sigma factor [Agromyces bracchium]